MNRLILLKEMAIRTTLDHTYELQPPATHMKDIVHELCIHEKQALYMPKLIMINGTFLGILYCRAHVS
jgi:hypothetical protein